MSIPEKIRLKLKTVISEIKELSHKKGKSSIFSVGTTMNIGNEEYFISSIREGIGYIGCNIMVSDTTDIDEVIEMLDGQVDEILVDVEKKKKECIGLDEIFHNKINMSELGFFRGNEAAAIAFEYIFISYCSRLDLKINGLKAAVFGVGHLGAKIVNILVEYGVDVSICDVDQERALSVESAVNTLSARNHQGKVKYISSVEAKNKKFSFIVGATNGIEAITEDIVDTLEHRGFVIDAGLRTLSEKAVAKANENGNTIFCLMALPGFNGLLTARREASTIVDNISKRKLKEGFSLVSGGTVGAYGDLIVDSAENPSKVIGVAKGNGLVLVGEERERFLERITLVEETYKNEGMNFAGIEVGGESDCYIIAEIANNHDQKKAQAIQLIEIAAEAGAHAVKFQTFTGLDIVSACQPSSDYDWPPAQKYKYWYEYLNSIMLPFDWYPELIETAHRLDVAFISTPCSMERAHFLVDAGVDALKIASMDNNNLPFLEKVRGLDLPVIISSGMAEDRVLDMALNSLGYPNNPKLALLHCISLYPTPPEHLSLPSITRMRRKYSCPIGFSDHSLHNYGAFAAVVMGAKIIEKHITIDRSLPGPDHYFSLLPEELADLVKGVREIEAGLTVESERPDKKSGESMYRSIHVTCDLPKGSIIEEKHLEIKRPAGGIEPGDYNRVVGKTLNQDKKSFDVLTWDDLS
ncbi:N-acetylneuraminate synthase family protein [Acidobacteriota bacterium]